MERFPAIVKETVNPKTQPVGVNLLPAATCRRPIPPPGVTPEQRIDDGYQIYALSCSRIRR